jgi:hypothetical protein
VRIQYAGLRIEHLFRLHVKRQTGEEICAPCLPAAAETVEDMADKDERLVPVATKHTPQQEAALRRLAQLIATWIKRDVDAKLASRRVK